MLFAIIQRLQAQGVGGIYISHRLHEVPMIGSRVTVMRDGKVAGTLPAQNVERETLIQLMTGRQVNEQYPFVLGHETIGIVDAVGEKVRSFKVGDRVVGGLLLSPTDSAYGSGWGDFSEYTLAGDHRAMVEDQVATSAHGWFEVYEIMRVVPPPIAVEDAVMLCTWREVYGAFGDFSLKAGDDILVYGGGPVGLSFVKFARLLDESISALVGYFGHWRSDCGLRLPASCP